MHPQLFQVPALAAAALAGALFAAFLTAGFSRNLYVILAAIAGGVGGALFAYSRPWGVEAVPLHTYGLMILIGFVTGVWMAARRSQLLGVAPVHCVDIGVYGVMLGVAGARAFHVLLHWHAYNPFHGGGMDWARVGDMFKLWEGGLVFYGSFITGLLWTWGYCKYFKLPTLAFLDLSVSSLIAGLAFGRIGCFLNGCCYGKVCDLPWCVQFPRHSPAFEAQSNLGLLDPSATASLPVHPTQIYASLAAAMIAAFLYAYWPHRKYDGQILSLMFIMAGVSRFFEELLRNDDPAAFPALSSWMTIAQWLAVVITLTGVGLMIYFRSRRTYFKAAPALVS